MEIVFIALASTHISEIEPDALIIVDEVLGYDRLSVHGNQNAYFKKVPMFLFL
jgi:hypothetical protein